MVWNIDYQDDSQIVVLSFSGEVSGPELKEAAASRIEFGKKKGATRFLIDATDMRAPKSMILDVLAIPAQVYASKQMNRGSKIAVIRPADPDSHWITEFYENASVMRGWITQIFLSRDSAIEWLLDSEP